MISEAPNFGENCIVARQSNFLKSISNLSESARPHYNKRYSKVSGGEKHVLPAEKKIHANFN